MKKKQYLLIIEIIIVAVIIVMTVFLVLNYHKEISKGVDLFTIKPVIVPINYRYEQSGIHIKGSYPQFSQADTMFNQKIKDFVTQEIKDFRKNKDEVAWPGDQGRLFILDVTPRIVQSNDRFISMTIYEDGDFGGAHGYRHIQSFNYDVKNQKEIIDLSYFFPNISDYLIDISKSSAKQLWSDLKDDAARDNVDDTIFGMIKIGTNPSDPKNFEVFTFSDKEITIDFQEYQVAFYNNGPQEVTIALPGK